MSLTIVRSIVAAAFLLSACPKSEADPSSTAPSPSPSPASAPENDAPPPAAATPTKMEDHEGHPPEMGKDHKGTPGMGTPKADGGMPSPMGGHPRPGMR